MWTVKFVEDLNAFQIRHHKSSLLLTLTAGQCAGVRLAIHDYLTDGFAVVEDQDGVNVTINDLSLGICLNDWCEPGIAIDGLFREDFVQLLTALNATCPAMF